MASKRELKKDIFYITEQVIEDILLFSETLSDEQQEEALAVLSDTVSLHNELIVRINHIDGKGNTKLVKQHFRKIIEDLLEGSNEAYKRLSELSGNKS